MKTFAAIIGWGVSVIVGLIGFAVVQHETQWRDAEIRTLTKQKEEIQIQAREAKADASRKLAKVGELADQMKVAKDDFTTAKDAELEASNRLVTALKEKIAAMESLPSQSAYSTQNLITNPSRVAVAASSPIVTDVHVPLPLWVPPQRYVMGKLIRARAEKEWKDNYTMVEHEIKRQTEALNRLMELNRWAGNRDLLAKAAKEWGDNYTMMLHEFERQAEAKKRLGQ